MENTFSIEVSTGELLFVARALGMVPLPLLDDNIPSSANSTASEAFAIQDSLIARRYGQRQRNGSLALDQTVAGIVVTTGAPDVILIATCVRGEERRFIRQIYGASGLVVEHEKRRDDIHCLTAVRNLAILGDRLRDFLDLGAQTSVLTAPLEFPESLIREALYVALVDGETACEDFLQSEGISSASAFQLAKAFSYPAGQSTLQAFRWKEGQAEPLGSLNFVRGRNGLWMLRPQGMAEEPTVEVTPVDADSASRQVDELLKSVFSPLPLSALEQVEQGKGAEDEAD